MATLAAGELSVDQVITVARHCPAHNDAEVASFAKVATVTQLRSTLSRYSFAKPDADPTGSSDTKTVIAADEAAAKGTVARYHDGHRFGLKVDAPGDDGALIEQAMTEAKDALFRTGHPQVTWMDALLEVCNRSLAGVESASRRTKYRVYVHLDTDGAWLNQGPALPGALLEKICCDTVIRPVWETAGTPVNVGRAQRIVPERTRRLVLDRDRACLVPGCGATQHLEIHHLIPLVARRPYRHRQPWRALPVPPRRPAPSRAHHHRQRQRPDQPAVHRRLRSRHIVISPTLATTCQRTRRPLRHRRGDKLQAPTPGERMDNRLLYFSPPPRHPIAPTSQPNALPC